MYRVAITKVRRRLNIRLAAKFCFYVQRGSFLWVQLKADSVLTFTWMNNLESRRPRLHNSQQLIRELLPFVFATFSACSSLDQTVSACCC